MRFRVLVCLTALMATIAPAYAQWYTDGTLHKATVAQWTTATERNRLATASDWAATVLGEKRVVRLGSIDRLKPYATDLKECIDIAAPAAPKSSRVVELASACAILLNW